MQRHERTCCPGPVIDTLFDAADESSLLAGPRRHAQLATAARLRPNAVRLISRPASHASSDRALGSAILGSCAAMFGVWPRRRGDACDEQLARWSSRLNTRLRRARRSRNALDDHSLEARAFAQIRGAPLIKSAPIHAPYSPRLRLRRPERRTHKRRRGHALTRPMLTLGSHPAARRVCAAAAAFPTD